uniref:Uncharacterized protein n=1 Tax=viral metagenome TaxID=1070528 RepID=A0A6M3X659_9ZZZZ
MTENKRIIYEVDLHYRNMDEETLDRIHTYTICEELEEDDGAEWYLNEIVVHAKALEDYRFCVDCDTVFDFWKYNHSLEDAGHEGHNVRLLTPEEFKEAVKDCVESGCFKEE